MDMGKQSHSRCTRGRNIHYTTHLDLNLQLLLLALHLGSLLVNVPDRTLDSALILLDLFLQREPISHGPLSLSCEKIQVQSDLEIESEKNMSEMSARRPSSSCRVVVVFVEGAGWRGSRESWEGRSSKEGALAPHLHASWVLSVEPLLSTV